MNIRTTCVLLIVLIALGYYIQHVDEKQPSTRQKFKLSEKIIPDWRPQDVRHIRLKNSSQEEVKISFQSGTWRLDRATQPRAHYRIVGRLLGLVSGLNKDIVLDGSMESYGITSDGPYVEFFAEEDTLFRLDFGLPTPLEKKRYAKILGRQGIYVVPDGIFELIDQDPDAFRDPQITHILPAHIRHVDLTWPDHQITLDWVDGRWFITEPVKLEADQEIVDRFLRKLAYLTAKKIIFDGEISFEDYGFDRPWFRVFLQTENFQSTEILLGDVIKSEDGNGQMFAAMETKTPTLYAVDISQRKFQKSVDDLRVRYLVDEKREDIYEVEITGADKTLKLVKSEDGTWQISGPNPLGPEMGPRLNQLADLLIYIKYVSVISHDKVRFMNKGIGFSSPLTEIRFMDQSGEVVNSIQVFDAVQNTEQSLFLGVTETSSNVYLIPKTYILGFIKMFIPDVDPATNNPAPSSSEAQESS